MDAVEDHTFKFKFYAQLADRVVGCVCVRDVPKFSERVRSGSEHNISLRSAVSYSNVVDRLDAWVGWVERTMSVG